jgi:hypothetical protein
MSAKRPGQRARPSRAPRGRTKGGRGKGARWSDEVTRHSNALTLEPGVFRHRSARAIAESLKRSAEHSRRRKSSPYSSAMSMLTFYINRAGRNLPASRRRTLARAKTELRHLFKRD